jgi:hypothetical protein
MKNLILILLGVVLLSLSLESAPPYPYEIKYQEVFYKTFELDSSASDTIEGKMFIPYCDSLAFVVEIVSADSAYTYDGSQIAVDARIRHLTTSGLSDTTQYANLQSAIIKASDEGVAKFGAIITQNTAQAGSRARLEVNVTNADDGIQKFKVRVYAIKRWR